MDLKDYANIAMKTRFYFSEQIFICPCHKSNEYYFQMHDIAQPEIVVHLRKTFPKLEKSICTYDAKIFLLPFA